jgi:hypothetical protein
VNKATIIEAVGDKRYNAASSELRGLAASPGFGSRHAPQGSDLPHELSDYIWDAELSPTDKIALFFEIYDDLPSYGMLMYAKHHYAEWSLAERAQWWRAFRERLQGSAAAPLSYSLWCDFFEDESTAEDAWHTLTAAAEQSLLRELLMVSGPVPWAVKCELLFKCAEAPALHQSVFEALLGAAFDYFGKVDEARAIELLERLQVREDPRYEQLVKRLAG